MPMPINLRNTFVQAAVLAGSVAATAAITVLGHDIVQRNHNRNELSQIAKDSISRAEYAVDYAVVTGFSVNDTISEPCSTFGINALQRLVHARSVVKDIRIINVENMIECSAFPDVLERTIAMPSLDNGKPGINKEYTLHKISVAGRDILGLAWRPPNERGYLVALDIESQLFDALPKAIRDDTHAVLAVRDLGSISEIGNVVTSDAPELSIAESQRYPIRIVLRLGREHFTAWNSSLRSLMLTLGCMLGALIGLGLIRELRRPVSPHQRLLSAMKNKEIIPYYQATFEAKTKHITGCEVLMRWLKPDGTMIAPIQFIPLAESTGAIVPMTRTIMQDALTEMAPLLRQNRSFKIAFNITSDDFVGADFANEMLALTKSFGIATKQVTLELTERQTSQNISALKIAVARVRQLGFRVALDDMGTGHNGLSHLQDIGADIIKIDKKFVDFIGKEAAADAIIELLVSLAKKLSMQTLAEGIETEEQRAALVKAGVGSGQGFLVGKPVPFQQFAIQVQQSHDKQKPLNHKAA